MNLYRALLTVHVLVAVLGVGLLTAIALLARSANRALAPLFSVSRVALILLFTTGAGVEYAAGAPWHEHAWFRGSALLLLFTGVLHGYARRVLLRGGPLKTVERAAWAMCATIGVITALMELKPT